MKSPRVLLGASFLVFVLTLVVTIPARLIDSLGGDALSLSGARGTVWRGSAEQVLAGPLRLGRTEWNTRVMALLLGRAAAAIDTELPGGFARGNVSISLTGTLRISDFEAAGRLEALGSALGFGQASGDATANVSSAELHDGWPSVLVGGLRLGNVPLAVGGASAAGVIDLAADFDVPQATADGRVPGRISDQGGPLEIAGTITLYPPSNYDIDALINARRDAPPEVQQGLLLLGPEQPDGGRQFTMSGSL